MPRWLKGLIWVLCVVLVLGLVGAGIGTYAWSHAGKQADQALANPTQDQPTVVRYSDGTQVGRIGKLYQITVDGAAISRVMKQAVVSIEDRNFMEHGGYDLWSKSRAAVADLTSGSLQQGGSTITEQLVKNVYLNQDVHSLGRKILQMRVADKYLQWWVHKKLAEQPSQGRPPSQKAAEDDAKREILTEYLNTVYFGRGAYGIEAAARMYFGVSAQWLNLPQSAFLAGAVQAPSDYATNQRKAINRRNQVLQAMVDTHAITPQQANAVRGKDLGWLPPRLPPGSGNGLDPYTMQLATDWLQGNGFSQFLDKGLQVKLTVESGLQARVRRAVVGLTGGSLEPRVGLNVVDPKTGALLATYSGVNFSSQQVPVAFYASRQPGSAMKPFVLAAGLANGTFSLTSPLYQAPSSLNVGGWQVNNFGGESFQPLDPYDAMVHSVNTVYAQMIAQVGPDSVVQLGNSLGLKDLQSNTSLTLGTSEVTPWKMTGAYAALANGGIQHDQYFVSEVRDQHGNLLYSHSDNASQPISGDVADQVTTALRGVVDHGTGVAAQIPGRQVAGKTGTTNSGADGWFMGYTPQVAVGVWVGRSDNGPAGLTGGGLPARIEQAAMVQALAGLPVVDFGAPAAPPDSTASPSPTESPSASPSDTPTPSASETPTETPSETPSPTDSPTASPSPSLETPSQTVSPTVSSPEVSPVIPSQRTDSQPPATTPPDIPLSGPPVAAATRTASP